MDTLLEVLGPLPECISVHLDRGYDSHTTREKLKTRSLDPMISEKGKPAPLRATKRWVVERTNSCNNAHKKLVGCTERRGRVNRTSGLPSPRWSSSYVGSSGEAGPTTAGRADLLADRSLLAEALSRSSHPRSV